MQQFSALRARLASFEHAYALAIQLRRHTELDQFIIRTGDALQPVRVTQDPPDEVDQLLALVL